MEPTVHDKLESIRSDIGSKEAQKLIKKIDKNGAELYDILGLGFAVESIYSNKKKTRKTSEDERLKNQRIQTLLAMRNKDSSKASLAKNAESGDKREYEKNITHDEVQQNYFENIYNV